MRSLLRAEWLRQRRRPDLWLVPLGVLAIAAWGWQTGVTSAENSLNYPPDYPPPDLAEQIAHLRDPFAFPAAFHPIVTGAFLAFIAMVHYGAAWTGSEFVRGTIRNIFLVHPERVPFVVVRLAALAGLALALVMGLVAVAALMPMIGGVVASPTATTPPSIGGLAAYALAAWFVLWFLALAGTTVAVLLRNGASAILLLFFYVLAELVVANAPIWHDLGQLAWLPALLPAGRLIHLLGDVAAATGFTPAGIVGDSNAPIAVPPEVGLVIVGAWTAILLVVLLRRIQTMDIGE